MPIDGEAAILDDRGRSSFAELQADLDKHGSERAVLYAFDLLFLGGEDTRAEPLEERRLALGGIIPARSAVLLSEEFTGSGADLFKVACQHELEGIVSKRLDKPYRSGRCLEWLTTKMRTQFVPDMHKRDYRSSDDPQRASGCMEQQELSACGCPR